MRRVLALVALLLLAGCVSVTVDIGDRGTTTRQNVTVEVVDVVDGDTVDVRFPDGSTDTVRLLGVDTPEPRGDVSPDEFGVPDTEAGRDCLRDWAGRASAFAEERLAGREVTLVFDATSDRRGGYGRLLAYVRVPGSDVSFNRALLDGGYARVYVSDFTRLPEFRAAAEDAKSRNAGLWACRSP